jgi:hypothetical protein
MILFKMHEISVKYISGRNETKTETVSYITPEDACRLWLVHPITSQIILQKYTKYTRPYLGDLNTKIQRMNEQMKHHDYLFTGHQTGLEWYACLERVYEEFLVNNLVEEEEDEVSSNQS